MWERPPGRGALLAVSLETSFTPVLENKNEQGGGFQVGEVSRGEKI